MSIYFTYMHIKEMLKQRNDELMKKYLDYNQTVESLAFEYKITVRQIQRIALKYNVIRTVAQANKQSARLKVYPKKPEHLKVKRKHLTSKLRYEILSTSKGCVVCGLSRKEGAILHVDHIDNNPQNNDIVNLQVLCSDCNLGKYRAYPVTLKMAP